MKPGRAVDHPEDLRHPDDAPEVADLGAERGEQLQAGQPRGLACGVDVEVAWPITDLADHETAVGTDGTGAGQEHQLTDPDGRDVQPSRRHRLR